MEKMDIRNNELVIESLQAIKLVDDFVYYFTECKYLDFDNNHAVSKIAKDMALIECENIIKLQVVKGTTQMLDYWSNVHKILLEL